MKPLIVVCLALVMTASFISLPAQIRLVADDRDDVLELGTKPGAEFHESVALVSLEHDPLFGNPFAQHLVLSLEELDLADQLVTRAVGEQEEQGLEEP